MARKKEEKGKGQSSVKRCERLKKERERLDKLGTPSHPLFGSSLSFKELSRADNPKTERTGARTERRPR
jgi:hypothetical protein